MKKLAFIILFLTSQLMFAQVEFTAKLSRNKIGQNENVRIDFTMNTTDGDNLELPSFEGFKVVGGPYQQISQSIVNGKRSSSKSFGFTLQPTKQGVLTIGSASVTIHGQVYKTEPVQITVTAPVQRPNDTSLPLIEPNESIHLVAQVSKSNPYLNEPITILYKLYVKEGSGFRNYSPTETPEYNDFWAHNIEVQGLEAKEEMFKGERYTSVMVKKVVLYPQKAGSLTIAPLGLDVAVEYPTNKRDFFGRRVYGVANVKVSTGSQKITVKPLPEKGKPEDFSGAVGTFDFIVTPNRTAVRQGETIELSIDVTGKGNLELFSLPKPIVPSALEMYDPITKKQVSVSLSGMSGKVSDKYTIIPQYQGKYIIKPMSFSYFDLTSNSYKTITSKEIMIDMIDGPTSGEVQNATDDDIVLNTNKESHSQFKFIELKTSLQPIKKKDFLFSTSFYLWYLLPLVLIPILILAMRKKRERDEDVIGNKIRSTNKLAKKYLSEAKKNQSDKQKFYASLEKALHNFLKAKLNIETSEMTKEKISEILTERKANPESIQNFLSLLESAELVRYAPSLASSVDQDYQKAVDTITELEKNIK